MENLNVCIKCNNDKNIYEKKQSISRLLWVAPNPYLTIHLKSFTFPPRTRIALTQCLCLDCGYIWFKVDSKSKLKYIKNAKNREDCLL